MENKQQSEALRLADQIESKFCTDEEATIAEELRRLHAESEQHLQELAAYRFTVENLRARVAELEGQLAAAQGMDALNQAIEAMQLALSSHGVQLLSYPPQDAWSSRRVDEKLRTAISALTAQAKQGGAANG